MEDRSIVDFFWQRAEEALAACGHSYGRYCQNNRGKHFVQPRGCTGKRQ